MLSNKILFEAENVVLLLVSQEHIWNNVEHQSDDNKNMYMYTFQGEISWGTPDSERQMIHLFSYVWILAYLGCKYIIWGETE